MTAIHVTDIEAAINHWREHSPSPDGVTLAPELRALAEVYALLVYHREDEADEATMPEPAREAWLAWYRSTPDTPCIAICSTAQGDAVCKGCGRTDDEVQHWTSMGPAAKRTVWRRITQDGSAWRFNRYAERAAERGATQRAAADRAEVNRATPAANPAANQPEFATHGAPARGAAARPA
ncbi:MAG: Phosphoenolpyruvate synthase [Burkholderiaceae bacterium]|nr:MAG: Phosphoenolpyruvate synthase [Burkholderiaceae bacterium]